MNFSNTFYLLLVTFVFSGTQSDKINLSAEFSQPTLQEKRALQKTIESKDVDKCFKRIS